MPYAYYYDVPGTRDIYRRVKAEIGEEPAKGLLLQLVVEHEGGLRHLAVWETRQDWERFREERVGPAVARVLAAAGMTGRPPEPVEHRLEVVDLLTGA